MGSSGVDTTFPHPEMKSADANHGDLSRASQPLIAPRFDGATAQGANSSSMAILHDVNINRTSLPLFSWSDKRNILDHALQDQATNDITQQHVQDVQPQYGNGIQETQGIQFAHRYNIPRFNYRSNFIHPQENPTVCELPQLREKIDGRLTFPSMPPYRTPIDNLSAPMQSHGVGSMPSGFLAWYTQMNATSNSDGMESNTNHEVEVAHGNTFGEQGFGAIRTELNPNDAIRRLGQTRRRPASTKLSGLTPAQKRDRHNEHTKASRLRVDFGLKKLKGTLGKARPHLKLTTKAEILAQAEKYVKETHAMLQVNDTGEPHDSPLSG